MCLCFSSSAHFLPCPFNLAYFIIHKSCSESLTLPIVEAHYWHQIWPLRAWLMHWVGSQSPLTTQSLSNWRPRNKTWHLTDCSSDRQLFSAKGKTKSVRIKTGWSFWIIRVLNLTFVDCCPSGGFSKETWLRWMRFSLSFCPHLKFYFFHQLKFTKLPQENILNGKIY